MASRTSVSPVSELPRPRPVVRAAGAAATEESIRSAALSLFVERGFHGTSMRDIATRSGTTVSHLYYYFPSKSEVLKSMMLTIVGDLLEELSASLQRVQDEPSAKLRALVIAQVLFHSRRKAEAFIGRSEMRSLEDEDRPAIERLHVQVTATFKKVVAEGNRLGTFDCEHVVEATSAIVTMCNGVSGWYQPGRGLSPDALANSYADLALRMVGARP